MYEELHNCTSLLTQGNHTSFTTFATYNVAKALSEGCVFFVMDKRALRIWVMTHEYPPNIIGGLGIVATQITNMLQRSGAKVTVICSGRSNQLQAYTANNGVRVIALPGTKLQHRSNKLHAPQRVLEAASKSEADLPDMIHVHSTQFAAAAIAASKKYRIPIVYTCHSLSSTGINSREGKRQTLLFRAAKRITVPSKWQAAAAGMRYPGMKGKIVVIPNGVSRIAARPTRKPVTQLLYAGRVIPSKGIDDLIRAVAQLVRKNRAVRLTIIGDGPTAYMRRERLLARRLGIASRIQWLPHLSHAALQRKYAAYGAVIVPSRKESFCLVALESMAQGVPLVTTLSGGLKEFVNRNNAQTIQAVNKFTIARAIEAVWQNPGKTRRRAINAKLTASRYLWPRIARRYESLFTKMRKRR